MKWSSDWIGSSNPGKQRLYTSNAPAHIRNKFQCSHLSKELKAKLKKRALRVRKGDKVKVMRGQFRGKTGTVDRVNSKYMRVYITGVEFTKKDGSKALYPLHSSNILITDLEGKDKRRSGEKK